MSQPGDFAMPIKFGAVTWIRGKSLEAIAAEAGGLEVLIEIERWSAHKKPAIHAALRLYFEQPGVAERVVAELRRKGRAVWKRKVVRVDHAQAERNTLFGV